MAGMDISKDGNGGLSLRRTSARLRASGRRKAMPAAKEAELLVCRNLGIVQDGKDVTERALEQFANRFKEQLPEEVIAAMRALFKIDNSRAVEVEDALISHGGADGLDHELVSGGASLHAQE